MANSRNVSTAIWRAIRSRAFALGAKYRLHSNWWVFHAVGQWWYVWYQPRSQNWMPKFGKTMNNEMPHGSQFPGLIPAGSGPSSGASHGPNRPLRMAISLGLIWSAGAATGGCPEW